MNAMPTAVPTVAPVRLPTARRLLAVALLALAACSGVQPLKGPVQIRAAEEERAPGVTAMPYLCEPGYCYVGREVFLDERDISGARFEQEGEYRALVTLEFTREGARKLALVTRSNAGRRLVVVHDGKVLATMLVEGELAGGKAAIEGKPADIQKVYETLTQPK